MGSKWVNLVLDFLKMAVLMHGFFCMTKGVKKVPRKFQESSKKVPRKFQNVAKFGNLSYSLIMQTE